MYARLPSLSVALLRTASSRVDTLAFPLRAPLHPRCARRVGTSMCFPNHSVRDNRRSERPSAPSPNPDPPPSNKSLPPHTNPRTSVPTTPTPTTALTALTRPTPPPSTPTRAMPPQYRYIANVLRRHLRPPHPQHAPSTPTTPSTNPSPRPSGEQQPRPPPAAIGTKGPLQTRRRLRPAGRAVAHTPVPNGDGARVVVWRGLGE